MPKHITIMSYTPTIKQKLNVKYINNTINVNTIVLSIASTLYNNIKAGYTLKHKSISIRPIYRI